MSEISSPQRESKVNRAGAPVVTLRATTAEDDDFVRRLYQSTRDDLAGLGDLTGPGGSSLVDLQFEAQRAQYARSFPSASDDIILLGSDAVGRLRVDQGDDCFRVIDIALLPHVQGRGIGTALLRGQQEQASQAGVPLRLHVQRDSRAEDLYRRLGFDPMVTSAVDPRFEQDVDLEMEWVPSNWLPIHLLPHQPSPLIEWFDAGAHRLVDPFFVQAFQRAEHRAQRVGRCVRRTAPLEELVAEAAADPGLAPTGFVLHMSRCGSTLVSQMLASDPENLVLSEPPVLDGFFRMVSASRDNEAQALVWLRALVSVLGRPRHVEQNLFIKFDAWHTTALPLLRRAFPDTPFVFLFRDPLEVLVSQERMGSAFMTPGGAPATAFGLDLAQAVALSPEEYRVVVLAAICRAGLDGFEGGGHLVDYQDLPSALDEILAHFAVAVTPARRARMEAAAAFDAKAPERRFVPDSERKRAAADPQLRAAASMLDGVWSELRAARGAQRPVGLPPRSGSRTPATAGTRTGSATGSSR